MNKEAVVELTKAAQRDVKGFKKAAPQILDHLKILKTHPERGHLLSGSLQGVRSLEFSLKGSGQYRAAYFYIINVNKVTVFMIGTHENFYKKAQKRASLVKELMARATEERQENLKKTKRDALKR
jgi:mRNA-degrading endonuclease RelE of RelBE toxin-antitoxin system